MGTPAERTEKENTMGSKRLERPLIRGFVLAAAVAAVLGLAAGPALAAAGIDPDADAVLRAMSKYLGTLPSFSANADIDVEIIDLDGQKVQLSSSGSILLVRPGRLYSQRRSANGEYEIFVDGKTVTLFSKAKGAYFQIPAPATLEATVAALRAESGFEISGADLLYAETYSGLVTDVVSGAHYGTTWVNGVECYHLAFRAKQVDWQIWVQTGEKPLPMKYVITTKWMTGAPQFTMRLSGWDTQPKVPAGRFVFTAPAGSRRLESLQVDESGEAEMK
jgi:hypothetical protein